MGRCGVDVPASSNRRPTDTPTCHPPCLPTQPVMIGLALGVADGASFTTLLVALSLHQFFEGFALGSASVAAGLGAWKSALLAGAYSLTTPTGTAIGACGDNNRCLLCCAQLAHNYAAATPHTHLLPTNLRRHRSARVLQLQRNGRPACDRHPGLAVCGRASLRGPRPAGHPRAHRRRLAAPSQLVDAGERGGSVRCMRAGGSASGRCPPPCITASTPPVCLPPLHPPCRCLPLPPCGRAPP